MSIVGLQAKRSLSAVLIATHLLSVSTAEAGPLEWLGLTGSSESATTPPSNPPAPTVETKPASRPSRPRARLPDLKNGDADGVMGDNEKELFVNKKTKAEDADEIGQYTVTEDEPLFSGGGANARVIGVVKKDEPFTVILPGERYSSIRLKDGQTGFVDKSKLVADGRKEAVEKEIAPPFVMPKTPSSNRKLEAVCDTCGPRLDLPNAADPKQQGRISEISRHLNEATKASKRPSTTPTTAFPANGRTSTKVARLISSARHHAVRKRIPADYLWKRFGKRLVGGNVSKGKCLAAVKDALLDAGILKSRPGTLSAKDFGPQLSRAGMKNVLPSLRQSMGGDLRQLAVNAPVGSVLVYEGGLHGRKSHGHIEIKTASQQYCSDFCQVNPVNIRNARRLIGIYTL